MAYSTRFAYRYTELAFAGPRVPDQCLAGIAGVLPNVRRPFKLLLDITDVLGLTAVSPAAMPAYFELRAKRRECGRAAILVSNNPDYEWVRTLEQTTNVRDVNFKICGFRDRAAALRWLEELNPEN